MGAMMDTKSRTMLALIAASWISATCQGTSVPPKRPSAVPATATWAGGADGGAWFLCDRSADSTLFECKVYSDFDGSLLAQGNYALRAVSWTSESQGPVYQEVSVLPAIAFRSFDGHVIRLQNQFVLLPHGVIDYPFGEGSGKTQEYDMGEPVGPEHEYGTN